MVAVKRGRSDGGVAEDVVLAKDLAFTEDAAAKEARRGMSFMTKICVDCSEAGVEWQL